MVKSKYSLRAVVVTLKQELKAHSLTYRDVAKALGVSESSVKQRFSRLHLSFEHIVGIAKLLDVSMSELFQKMEQPVAWQLPVTLEIELLSDPKLLLVYVHTMDDWMLDDIVATYEITKAECIKYLFKLQELGIIELLQDNRVRKLKPRNPRWAQNGPLYSYSKDAMADFLSGPFETDTASYHAFRGMLSPAAIKQLQEEMLHLKQRFADLHEESLLTPFERRRYVVLFMAEREWLPRILTSMRRKKREA